MLLGSWSWTPPRTSPTQSTLSSINKRSFCNYNGGHSVQVDLAQRCHHKLKCSINQGGAGENFPDDQLNLQVYRQDEHKHYVIITIIGLNLIWCNFIYYLNLMGWMSRERDSGTGINGRWERCLFSFFLSYEINDVWVNSLLVINWYYFLTSRLDQANSDEMKSKLAKLGLAAVLAYGLFDAVTYTSFFVLAFLGYEKSTGKNPAANLQALFGVRNWQLLRTFLV